MWEWKTYGPIAFGFVDTLKTIVIDMVCGIGEAMDLLYLILLMLCYFGQLACADGLLLIL